MNAAQINEIVGILPQGRTIFHYYSGRYALMLMQFAAGKYSTVGNLKKSPFGRLLDSPEVKKKLANYGSGKLNKEIPEDWAESSREFLLTLDRWGHKGTKSSFQRSWYQTTRNQENLVLQVNFSNRHNRPYTSLVDPEDERYFEMCIHPVRHKGSLTMSWARMDIDLDTGEALIEEIQSDWIRDAFNYGTGSMGLPEWNKATRSERTRILKFKTYLKNVLSQYQKTWEETTLAATIWFLREELGIHRIYYHTWESGNFLKGLDRSWSAPPVSLYSRLPRKFCFIQTSEIPGFLKKTNNRRLHWGIKNDRVKFFYLEI